MPATAQDGPTDDQKARIVAYYAEAEMAWLDPAQRDAFFQLLVSNGEWNLYATTLVSIIPEIEQRDPVTMESSPRAYEELQHAKFIMAWLIGKYVRQFRAAEK